MVNARRTVVVHSILRIFRYVQAKITQPTQAPAAGGTDSGETPRNTVSLRPPLLASNTSDESRNARARPSGRLPDFGIGEFLRACLKNSDGVARYPYPERYKIRLARKIPLLL